MLCGTAFLALWQLVDGRFNTALALWVERYGAGVLTDSRFDKWPILKARRDEEVLPYLRARWAVLAAGGTSGLGLLAVQVYSAFEKAPEDACSTRSLRGTGVFRVLHSLSASL